MKSAMILGMAASAMGFSISSPVHPILADDVVFASIASKLSYGESCGHVHGDWSCVSSKSIPHGNTIMTEAEAGTDLKVDFLKNPGRDVCALAFRGTEYNTQFLNSLSGLVSNTVPMDYLGSTVQVASGYAAMFDKLKTTIDEKKDLAACSEGIFLVGHSLGGGLATLADIYLENQNYVAKSITFGAPRVLTGAPANHNDLRVYHNNDAVAGYVPGATWVHAGPGIQINCEGWNFGVCDDSYSLEKVGKREGARAASLAISYHSNSLYRNYMVNFDSQALQVILDSDADLKANGESCMLDTSCESQYCSSGSGLTCQPKKESGKMCHRSGSCASGHCDWSWYYYKCR